jgi:peptidoglycan/LPS O-acetylase OafA/YrhL
MMNRSVAAKTSLAINPGRTSSVKEHFEVPDGLRGGAAFLIVIFHLFNYSFGWDTPLSLVYHAYLAVNFAFGLSGFVVAYAYDDRWTKMSVPPQFFRIRLHSLVLAALGAAP